MQRSRLDREFGKVRNDLKVMSELVQKALNDAIAALKNRDIQLSLEVIRVDEDKTNILYREIEERCIHTIALHQPVAGDLRFISTAMDVASNLERIGDYSKDIAMIVPFIVNEKYSGNEERVLEEMGKIAEKMTGDSIDAFINKDRWKVGEVNACEEKIDALYESIFPKLKNMVRVNCDNVSLVLNLLLIAKCLERIGDHSMNITDRTMYVINGGAKYL